jgi:hypothetical protein
MRTVKSTRREEIEIISNLNTFRNACLHLHDRTMNLKFKSYVEKLISGRGYHISNSNDIRVMHPTSAVERIANLFSNQNLRFFSTCTIGRVRFTIVDYSKSKAADDSAVLFKLEHEFHFGLITSIFTDEDNETLFELWPLSHANSLIVPTNGQSIDLSSIQQGTLEKNNNYYYIPPDDIVEKCVYWIKKSNKAVFFRFPNLEEGS